MRGRKEALTLVEFLAVIAIIGLLIFMMLPVVRSSRQAANRSICQNNLKQISLALLNYESALGTFPPAYTVDEEGNRLHSWRTLILPYLEQEELYESIDLSKPWDDPVNAKAREHDLYFYQCPSAEHDKSMTTYLAVVGEDCAFAGSEPRLLSDVKDGEANTMAVVDAPADKAVHWMSPEDMSAEEVLEFSPDSKTQHTGIFQAVFLDYHVEAIRTDVDKQSLKSMLTIAGGEEVAESR